MEGRNNAILEAWQERKQMKERQSQGYNMNAKDLPPLSAGDVVRVQPERKGQQWSKATVVCRNEQKPRSYKVETEAGQFLERNRRHLKQTPSTSQADGQEDPFIEEGPPTLQAAHQEEPSVIPEEQEKHYQTRYGRTVRMPSHLIDYIAGKKKKKEEEEEEEEELVN